jgi:ATP/maltotriose-dependent transcriptional regulator MalT
MRLRLPGLIAEAQPVFEAAGDDWALAELYCARLFVADLDGSSAAVAAAAERVIEHSRRADFELLAGWAERCLADAHYHGATPVEACLRWLDEHPEVERRNVLPQRDGLLAMLGRFDDARRLHEDASARAAELGMAKFEAWLASRRYDVAMLEGDATVAEAAARACCEQAESTGDLGNFMLFSCNLARALLELDRDDEAEQWVDHGHATAPSKEPVAQVVWHQVRGKLRARRGDLEEGERLAREAVAIAGTTDMLNAHAAALVDLAEVLVLGGRSPRAELEGALALYDRKGNLVMAERTRVLCG